MQPCPDCGFRRHGMPGGAGAVAGGFEVPRISWRHLLSAHNTSNVRGCSVNFCLRDLLNWRTGAARTYAATPTFVALKRASSYCVDDGVIIQVQGGPQPSEWAAISAMCKATVVVVADVADVA